MPDCMGHRFLAKDAKEARKGRNVLIYSIS